MDLPVNKESLFNSSFESLRRIQETLTQCNMESKLAFIAMADSEKMTSLKAWWLSLKNLYKEIHAKLNVKEIEEVNDLFKKVSKIKIVSSRKTKDQGVVKEIDKKLYYRKWHQLWDIEVMLRGLATKRGLLLKDRDNAMATF